LRNLEKVVSLLAALVFFAPATQATTIDFTTFADGTSVTTIGDATFSLAGVGEAGSPVIDTAFGGGLWNSSDNASYPTNTILRVVFAAGASGVSWLFDNEGGKTTSWTMFDSASSVIATGSNSTSGGFQLNDQSSFSGVSRIDWNNNGNNWLFALGSITYTAETSEPATIAIFGLGLLGIAFARRKRVV